MKLQIFDNYNSRKKSPGRPQLRTISLYMSNGSITFSALTAKELGITEKAKFCLQKTQTAVKTGILPFRQCLKMVSM